MAPLQAGALQWLHPSQVDEAAALAAAAFVHSPAYAYIYEGLDEGQRVAALTWLFAVNIRLRTAEFGPSSTQGCGRCALAEGGTAASPGKKMLCFFMMQPPSVTDISALTMLANGMLYFPCRFGWRPLVRLLQVKGYHERVEEVVRARFAGLKFAHLERMVVHPSAQGGGIGTRCLSAALAEAAEVGHAVLLSTQSERNVKFYRKLGFEQVDCDTGYFKTTSSSGETNWTMIKHPPKSTTASATVARSGSSAVGLAATAAILVTAACAVLALVEHPPDPASAAATKPFTTFSEFYPLYLDQHSQPMTKLLHAVGTTLVIAGALMEPRLIVAGACASAVGLAVFRLCIGLSHGFVEFGAAVATALAVTQLTTGSVRPALCALVLGYGFAWGAHKFVEENRPATFTYPIFSLWGDFQMLGEVLLGKHSVV
jgi:GNAT superfamily N-acetyltransferase